MVLIIGTIKKINSAIIAKFHNCLKVIGILLKKNMPI
jgi:hypothetical protein